MIEPSYPSTLPDGTDVEYTPRPEWRDLRTTDDLIADHERRIRSLERALARVLAVRIVEPSADSGAFLVAANPPFIASAAQQECTR